MSEYSPEEVQEQQEQLDRRAALRHAMAYARMGRVSYTDDLAGTGDYTEVWEGAVGTITVTWSPYERREAR